MRATCSSKGVFRKMYRSDIGLNIDKVLNIHYILKISDKNYEKKFINIYGVQQCLHMN